MFGVVAGLVVMLCGGLGAVGYVWYDRATAPDLSAPDVVVDAYLREELVNRDDTRAEQYLCDGADVSAVVDYRAGLIAKEKQLGVTIQITWGALETRGRRTADATVDVTVKRSATVAGVRQSFSDKWTFHLTRQSGWHICGASKIG